MQLSLIERVSSKYNIEKCLFSFTSIYVNQNTTISIIIQNFKWSSKNQMLPPVIFNRWQHNALHMMQDSSLDLVSFNYHESAEYAECLSVKWNISCTVTIKKWNYYQGVWMIQIVRIWKRLRYMFYFLEISSWSDSD